MVFIFRVKFFDEKPYGQNDRTKGKDYSENREREIKPLICLVPSKTTSGNNNYHLDSHARVSGIRI